ESAEVDDLKIPVDERAPPRRHVVPRGLTVPNEIPCPVDTDGRAENAFETCIQLAEIERRSARRSDKRPEVAVRRAGASDDETCVADAIRVALVASERAEIDERTRRIDEGVDPSVGR